MNRFYQWLAHRLPIRLLYFSVVESTARLTTSDEGRRLVVPEVPAMDVAKFLERGFLVLAMVFGLSLPAFAETVITAAAATATQSSSFITRTYRSPHGVLVHFDVTVGTSLDLTVTLEVLTAKGDAVLLWATDSAALTGISDRDVLFTNEVATGLGAGIDATIVVPVPTNYRVTVVHGNANAATYTVDLVERL